MRPELAILGLSPAPESSWRDSQTFRRLVDWSGIRVDELLGVELVNVWATPSRPCRPLRELGERAIWARRRLAGRSVLALGVRAPWLLWPGCRWSAWSVGLNWPHEGAVRRIVVVPHPSGRNRSTNSPAVRDRIGRIVREWYGQPAGR